METQDDEVVEEVARMDSVTNAQGDSQISVGQAGALARPSPNVVTKLPDELTQDQQQLLVNSFEQMALEGIPDSKPQTVVNIIQNANIHYGSSQADRDKKPEWQYNLDEARKIFVKTMGYENACDALEQYGHVLIIGSPGSGKTTMSYCIMDIYLKKGYKVEFYKKASKFSPEDVNRRCKTLLVFDDIFGEFSPTTEIVNCRTVFKYMKTRFRCLEEKRGRWTKDDDEGTATSDVPFKVIMNCRTNIFERVKRKFLEYQNSFLRGCAITDLTTLTKLSEQEKEKILKKHLELGKCEQLSSEEIRTIASLDYSSLGFPHICELFVDINCQKEEIDEFFRKPMLYLVKMIEDIFDQSEKRARVLLLMVLNDGVLNLLDLQNHGEMEASGLDHKLSLCREIIRNVPTPTDISEAAKQEKNSLLTSVQDEMKFSHPTIHDAVAFVVGNKNPLFVLEHCSIQFITERTEIIKHTKEPSGGDYTNFKIILTPKAGLHLLERLAKEIVGGNFALPLSHQCLKSEQYVDNLFEQLSKEDETHSYLHSIDNRYGQGFLFWSSFICMGPVTKCSLKFTTYDCHEVLEGCFGCCMSGNAHSFQALTWYSSFHQAIVSSTLASILEGQSETRSVYRSLSSASPTKPDIPDEKETVRMHGDNRDMLIHIAAANGFDSVVQILRKLGCPIDTVGGNEMTALMYACYLGHLELVKILVSFGADPLLLDEEGDNCLHLACRGGSIEIVRYLLAQNMDINERGEHDRTPLMYAAYNGYEEIARFLLLKGAVPNSDLTLVRNQDNALHLTCAKGHTPIARILLEEGQMDIEVQGEKKRTPIMYACRHGHLETAKELKKRGAQLNISDDTKLTCLHLATICGHVETAQWILTCSVESPIESVNSKGRTPLMMAFQHGQSNMIEFLLQKGSNFDHIDVENGQYIHFAAKSGVSSLVDLCLEKGQDIDAVTDNGLTPVKAACRHGHLDLVKYLVQKGANVQDDTNGGCLHSAVLGGHLHVVEYIVDTFPDLDINKPGFHAMTPFMIACKYAFIDIFTFLLRKGVDVTCHDEFNLSCLHTACRGGSLEIVKTLINLGTLDIEEEDVNGMTPLGHAVKCDKFEVMEYLIQEGADINAETVGQRGPRSTLLHFACNMNGMGTKIPEMLIQYGIHVDASDSNNKTPVMCAVSKNNIVLVKFLLSKGCSLNTYNQRGIQNTLLHYACGFDNVGTEIIDELVSRGIQVNSRNSYHQTPVMCAARRGNRDVVVYLISHGADLWLSDRQGKNCMCHAEEAGQTQMFEYLRQIMYQRR